MSDKDSPQNVIDSYRKKRQQRTPFIVGGIAVALVVIGILLLALWLTGGDGQSLALFASDTPTPTETFTPTLTPTVTLTPTPTNTAAPTDTPEPTFTSIPSEPFIYVVQENDTCVSIAEQFEIDYLYLIQLNGLTSDCIIRVGDELLIPPPGSSTPTPTPLPENMPPGTRIEYTVLPLDSLGSIAEKFNSTVERLRQDNEELLAANQEISGIEDTIYPGQVLIVVVNIATPVPTSTPGISDRLTQQAELTQTLTPAP
ncbi:MAG: LysM peptidoglycan-binding domain-containing protein [Anaerolineales bacterium]|jgi:LysM repeat protein